MIHIFAQTDNGGSGVMEFLTSTAVQGLNILGNLFLFVIGVTLALFVIFFLIDILQTKDAIRRNFPVIGRFRSLFSNLGEFFRQYFFALDREEMPFNRAERDWINDVSKDGSNTEPFGSTRRLTPGAAIFANGMFPKLEEEYGPDDPLIIGPDCKRPYAPYSFFNVSAMSYGSLSQPAVRALSLGANLAGCWLNTGEGGLSPYHLEGNCDIVFQLGTAKFGARNHDGSLNVEKLVKLTSENPNVRMLELKLSQGAKPGKGGILPAEKVTAEIAEIRGIPEGEAAISPNRHVDAGTPEELLNLVHTMREATGLPVGIKFVVGNISHVEQLLIAIKARGMKSAPDFFTIDGGDGGTGAAPMPLMDNVGLTIREGLPAVDDLLRTYKLHERIRIIASGKLITPAEVAWAFAAGADFVNSARGFMFALGCIQAMKCNENTCPTGVTTHNKRLQRGLNPENKAVRVMNYCKNIRKEVEMIAHSCGVDHPRDLRRKHVLIVQDSGRSLPFSQVWGERPRLTGQSKEDA
ncbi:FMN-binding glutamate synthase family protein [Robiginitomaculum antarcticum]|uniref:FMN-binding glutamate synthase family protein n=1 Tax=Robiginitomaculum antarcticum TaxID=437507 RepID=UPI0003798DDA|nr:FMN-binding glutamate synthase family protein [Robiginitomaculum antarcticum]